MDYIKIFSDTLVRESGTADNGVLTVYCSSKIKQNYIKTKKSIPVLINMSFDVVTHYKTIVFHGNVISLFTVNIYSNKLFQDKG